MKMSLTKDDLSAIKDVISETVDPQFGKLERRIANGFVDVETRLQQEIKGSEAKLGQQIRNVNMRFINHEERISALESGIK